MNLEELNALPAKKAEQLFCDCNAAVRWYSQMAGLRPFASRDELHRRATEVWQSLNEPDYLEAFEAHPMIGDVESLRKKYASTKTIAAGEQSGAALADESILNELATLNHAYKKRFGFIFIVFATGKSAGQMLQLLRDRIENDRATEIRTAGAEQLKITLLRLDKLLGLPA